MRGDSRIRHSAVLGEISFEFSILVTLSRMSSLCV